MTSTLGLAGSTGLRIAGQATCASASCSSQGLCWLPRLRHGVRVRVQSQGRRARVVLVRAEQQQQQAETKSGEEDVQDSKILQYCSIDKKRDKRTIGELEADFLEALQGFYLDGKPTMSNEEFDNLKQELLWEGSNVVILSSEEQKFMEASLAYTAGKPVLTDAEYDELKLQLKRSGSKVAIEGPRCSLRSRKVVSDSTVAYLKMTLLNLPAAVVALGLVFFLDDLTGFEITYLLELPEPYSFLFTWFVVLPAVFLIAQALSRLVLKDPLILKGPCPECGEENTSFFGEILSVPDAGKANNVSCPSCKTNLIFDKDSRLISVDDSPKPEKKGKAGAKKSAPAASSST